MNRHRFTARFAAFVAATALVVQAAVPLLAAQAAALRGVAVAEVCPIYGISLGSSHAAHDHAAMGHEHAAMGHEHATQQPSSPAHHDSAGHDHCVLTALAFMASVAPASLAVAARRAVDPPRLSPVAGRVGGDAVARWAIQLAHAPPTARRT